MVDGAVDDAGGHALALQRLLREVVVGSAGVRWHVDGAELVAHRLLELPADRQDAYGVLDDFERLVVTGVLLAER